MKILYVDESGCLGMLPTATSNIQPVFVVAGVGFDSADIIEITSSFMELKREFFPGECGWRYVDTIIAEIKGGDLRRDIALGNRNERRAAFRFLDKVLDLVDDRRGQIFGRIWVKGIGHAIYPRSVYTYSMQDICTTFQAALAESGNHGIILADSRSYKQNTNLSHSVFTKKFQVVGGDVFPCLLEMPFFGHSQNHAGIQIADLVCSALLFPMAVQTYCVGYVANLHVRDYSGIKNRYAQRLRSMQYRYCDQTTQRWRGGLTVSDHLAGRGGADLFR
jgi:hypothetical protein